MTIPAAPPAPPAPPAPAYAEVTAPATASAPVPTMSAADEKTWSTLTHLGGLLVTLLAPPFGFAAPLIAFLVLKDRGPFVRAHTLAALNFQLTVTIAYVVGGILSFVLIGLPIVAAAFVLNIVFGIIAAVKANQGQWYTYPVAIPFVR